MRSLVCGQKLTYSVAEKISKVVGNIVECITISRYNPIVSCIYMKPGSKGEV